MSKAQQVSPIVQAANKAGARGSGSPGAVAKSSGAGALPAASQPAAAKLPKLKKAGPSRAAAAAMGRGGGARRAAAPGMTTIAEAKREVLPLSGRSEGGA